MKAGGPAFPQTDQSRAVNPEGMSLRDWFAGQALAGAIGRIPHAATTFNPEACASDCYRIADFMLAERDKETK